MNYGLPYMGSKNKIAEWVVSHFPERENFYDLFCGGCAITHRVLLTNKYQKIYFNDINGQVSTLFLDAINGKYHNETRWITREQFFAEKETDAFIKYIWSFGHNGRTYLYGENIEQLKKACHEAVVNRNYKDLLEQYNIDIAEYLDQHTTTHDRRLALKRWVKENKNERLDLEHLVHLERLEHLVHLERLEHLVHLERLEQSYIDVKIKPNSFIYCDIPYKGTEGYHKDGFDHETFYNWAEKQTQPMLISEYSMPEDRFFVVDEIRKCCAFSATNKSLVTTEKLYCPMHQKDWFTKQQTLF